MQYNKMIEGIRIFLEGAGATFENGHLDETPKRVARAWAGNSWPDTAAIRRRR